MKNNSLLLCLLVFFFFIQSTSFASSVSLSEPAMTDAVDDVTSAPKRVASSFSPDTSTLYATIKLNNAPLNTQVSAVFFLLANGTQKIAEDTLTTNGTGYISFSLNPPASGWPIGPYRVVFSLNGQKSDTLDFSVVNEVVKNQTSPSRPTFRTFRDPSLGFAFDLPDTWDYQVLPGRDYLLRGKKNSDQYQIILTVQTVDLRKGEIGSLDEQMLYLKEEYLQIQGSSLLKESSVETAGNISPYFIVSYPSNNIDKELVTWGHFQLGVNNKPYLHLISFASPENIYQENLDILHNLLDTLQLSTPAM